MTELSRAAAGRRERMGDALDLARTVLLRLGRQGLTRLSRASVTELRALVQSAHNGRLVKLERTLEQLATTVEHYLDRDPNFRAQRYVERLNRAWLLVEVGRSVHADGTDPSDHPALLGEPRRSYVEQSEPITVQALGAAGWVTDSGFVGITVHLRGPDRLYQITNARPVEWFGNEPVRLLRQPLSDTLDRTIQDLAHGAFELHQARVSWDGRISASGNLFVAPAPWSSAAYTPCAADSFAEAAALLSSSVGPLDGAPSRLVLLQCHRWGPVTVDEKAGLATLVMRDPAGVALSIEVPLRPENNLLIDNLQLLAKRSALRPEALFGRLRVAGGLRFEPMTAVYATPIKLKSRRTTLEVNEVHLGLEALA